MIRFAPLFAVGAVVSLFFFPWPVSALLALLAALGIPLAPFALGVIADALYLAPHAFPLATALGGVATAGAFFVRSRLAPGILER